MREFPDHRVKNLSGGQRRRLTLAMELANDPSILLCDEVTSGLDYLSEGGIVSLLRRQSREERKLILSVTHSLDHLENYDSVLVLNRGEAVFHGTFPALLERFGIGNANELYAVLERRNPEELRAIPRDAIACPVLCPATGDQALPAESAAELAHPGVLAQTRILLTRRLVTFVRSRAGFALQLGFTFGFPLIVSLFAWGGIPDVKDLSWGLGPPGAGQFEEAREFLAHSSKVGSLVSGIVMFEVILLALMGANNSGREIAVERQIFEIERISGLSPLAYVASKTIFMAILVLVQSVWMGAFVHLTCNFPGDPWVQTGFLILVNAAVTSTCLGLSAVMRSPEQASLGSVYLVGFQLPLSGAILALPESIGAIVRPLISSYWSWSGMLQTLHDGRYHQIVESVAQSPLASSGLCFCMLLVHIAVGLLITWVACERRQTQQ